MTYDKLVTRLVQLTGLHSDVVKKVLVYLPDALMTLPDGGNVRTPLGVFRMVERKPRMVRLPDGATEAEVSRKRIVKLRPGSRLKSDD